MSDCIEESKKDQMWAVDLVTSVVFAANTKPTGGALQSHRTRCLRLVQWGGIAGMGARPA
jgi:hypothetical protein